MILCAHLTPRNTRVLWMLHYRKPHSPRCLHETCDARRTLLIAVSEIFLKDIWIIRSIIIFSGEFAIFCLRIEIRIASCCHENGFYLFFGIVVWDFRQSSEIIFNRKNVYQLDFSSNRVRELRVPRKRLSFIVPLVSQVGFRFQLDTLRITDVNIASFPTL